jgi:hypothetical protein
LHAAADWQDDIPDAQLKSQSIRKISSLEAMTTAAQRAIYEHQPA